MTIPLLAAGWHVWLAGPAAMALQLAACLALGALVARREGRSPTRWLALAFCASIVPAVGVLAMAAAAALARASGRAHG